MDNGFQTKIAVYQALVSVLSDDYEIRTTGEAQLRSLEVVEGYGVNLVNILKSTDEPDAIRQLSVVLLRKYVEIHWDSHQENFRPPEISAANKQVIKETLCNALGSPLTKIRTTVAYVLAFIVHCDFPHAWPELVDWILIMIRSRDEYKTHGAMRVLLECVGEVKIALNPDYIPNLLESLHEVVENCDNKYTLRTRSRAVEVCKALMYELALMCTENSKLIHTLHPILTPFIDLAIKLLQVPDGPNMDIVLRSEIFKMLALIVSQFVKSIESQLPTILPLVWEGLVKAIDIYLNQSEEITAEYDEEGDILNIDTLIISAFDLVTSICESSKLCKLLHSVLPDLFFHIIRSMQVTEIMLSSWNRDMNKYIEDDSEDTFDFNVKISARNVLRSIMNSSEKSITVPPFCEAICRYISTSEALREANNSDWWKGLEASMFALGSVSNYVSKQYQKKGIELFDLSGYILRAATYTQAIDIPLLASRCIWICACFCSLIEPETLSIAINNTIHLLQTNENICVRISALKAVINYCTSAVQNKITSGINNYLQGILIGLCLLIDHDVPIYSLVLDAFICLIKVDKIFVTNSAEKIILMTFNFFLKHGNDAINHSKVMELIRCLSQHNHVLPTLQQKFASIVLNMLSTPAENDTMSAHATALEMLGILVRYQTNSMNDSFIKMTFNSAIDISMKTNDFEVLQASIECMRGFLLGAYTEISSYKDSNGHTGIDYILKLIFRVLDPDVAEYSCCYLGRLMILLFVRAGEYISHHMETLLRAFLSKIHTTKSAVNMQSLIITFSYLTYTQTEGVLAFLTNVPGPKGEPALSFVLNEWIYIHTEIVFGYEYKLSMMALIRLLQYGLMTEHHILHTLTIPEHKYVMLDEPTTSDIGKWIDMPILVKVFKLLINDLGAVATSSCTNPTRSSESTKVSLSDVSMASVQSTVIMEESEGGGEPFLPDICTRMEENPLEEPFITADIDPIANINPVETFSSFLISIQDNPVLQMFVKYLNPKEMNILLNKIGIEFAHFHVGESSIWN